MKDWVSSSSSTTMAVSLCRPVLPRLTRSLLYRSGSMWLPSWLGEALTSAVYKPDSGALYAHIMPPEACVQQEGRDLERGNLNTPTRSLKRILLLFEDPAIGAMGPAFGRNSWVLLQPANHESAGCGRGNPKPVVCPGNAPVPPLGRNREGVCSRGP